MDKKDLIENEIEKTLRTAEGIGKAEANPFLFTRIIDKMEESNTAIKRFNFKIAITAVVICILINITLLFYNQAENNTSNYNYSVSDSVRTAQIKSFASEYSSTNNFYFY